MAMGMLFSCFYDGYFFAYGKRIGVSYAVYDNYCIGVFFCGLVF